MCISHISQGIARFSSAKLQRKSGTPDRAPRYPTSFRKHHCILPKTPRQYLENTATCSLRHPGVLQKTKSSRTHQAAIPDRLGSADQSLHPRPCHPMSPGAARTSNVPRGRSDVERRATDTGTPIPIRSGGGGEMPGKGGKPRHERDGSEIITGTGQGMARKMSRIDLGVFHTLERKRQNYFSLSLQTTIST